MLIAWRLRGWPVPRQFYAIKKKHMREGGRSNPFYHFHGVSLEEVFKSVEKGEDFIKMWSEFKIRLRLDPFMTSRSPKGKEKQSARVHEEDEPPVIRKLTQKEQLQISLGEHTEMLNNLQETFEDLSTYKAKEMVNLVSEETNAEEQKSAFCSQRERIREDIARLELERKELAKHIEESEIKRNTLANKRHKYEFV